MELAETIELMKSDSYKDRFIAEYSQLDTRLEKLKGMLKRHEEGTLEFTPSCPVSLLKMQVKVMEDYKTILDARAAIESVDVAKL